MTERWEPIVARLRMMQHAIADAYRAAEQDDAQLIKISIRDLGWLIFECDQRWQRVPMQRDDLSERRARPTLAELRASDPMPTLEELAEAAGEDMDSIAKDMTTRRARSQRPLDNPASTTCPKCGMTSYNSNDVRHRYCGNCHMFYSDMEGVT